ncbi:flavohemoglobin [Diaporthe helianthi]|uniref:nitric oxide dioxygenase n=1 Tax=Diaporthe helianthi TaxID=158607 RepID=A0A2P5IA23_DIAHE|nr:flavohemoglobin [Diaporthe helianthi]
MTVTPSTTAGPKPGDATNGDAVPPAAPLSQAQLAIIKATVPVLQVHGEAITKTMYDTMIGAHPELHNVFSTTSQVTGRQPRALARSVLAYAMYIDDLPKLAHAVERIAQKHVSLFIQPEQYDIVGGFLIGAIGQVLGDAATPEIVDAWTAAYGVLAMVFIGREKELYKADENWTGWRKFRIARRAKETEDVASFYLEPVDGAALPSYLPGQYVSLQVFVKQLGYNQSRQYSLSQAPDEAGKFYRVSVKKDRDVEAGIDGLISNMLHDGYGEGDVVELSHPHGEFFLDPSDVSKDGAPAVLISAGIGATPLMSMLHALAKPSAVKRPVSWIHTSRSRATQPFADEVVATLEQGATKDRASAHVHLRQGLDGEGKPRLDIAALDRESKLFLSDARTEYFICGPEKFMLDARKTLGDLGVEKTRIYLELFATGDVEDDA